MEQLPTHPLEADPPPDHGGFPGARGGGRLADALGTLALLAVLAALAVLVAWPCSVHPTVMPTDPNASLHMLGLRHLHRVLAGDALSLHQLEELGFPGGLELRYLAWPLLLSSLPLVGSLGPVAATHVSVLLHLVATGFSMALFLGHLGLGRVARLLGGLAWMANPMAVFFLTNGNYEYLAGWTFPLAIWGLLRGGWPGLAGLAAGLAGALFSSPYLAVPLLVLLSFLALGARGRFGPLLLVLLVLLPGVALYYGPASKGGEVGVTASPSLGMRSATLSDLVDAERWGGIPEAPRRLRGFLGSLSRPVPERLVDTSLGTGIPARPGGPGEALLALGLLGLFVRRREPQSLLLALGGLACLLLALGPVLRVTETLGTSFPLPWRALESVPFLGRLGAVHRFNLGLVFALAVGFARLMDLATDRAARVSRRVGAVCAGPLLAIGLGLLVMDVFSGESGLPRDAARLRLPKGLLVDAGPIQPVLKGPLPGTLGATLALLSGQPVGTPISLRVDPRARPGEFLSAAEEARLVAETPRLREGGVGVVAIFHKNFRRHPEHAPPPAPEALGQPTFFGEGVWSYRLR